MATSVTIKRAEIELFLSKQGFVPLKFTGVKELVMGKLVDKGLTLRVYTSIEGDESRGNGQDAIRAVLFAKVDGEVKLVGTDRRVHRVQGWRLNLQDRLDRWREMVGPVCPECGSFTMRKRSKNWDFFGCCRYPACHGSIRVNETVSPPLFEELVEEQAAVGERLHLHEVSYPGDVFDQD